MDDPRMERLDRGFGLFAGAGGNPSRYPMAV
jgi:hypothetical protein